MGWELFIIKQLQAEAFRKSCMCLNGRVLDVGCGTRDLREWFPRGTRYIGIDESRLVKPDVVAKANILPFRDGCFDNVICTEVLEHVVSPGEVLQEINRVVRPGGVLYLSAPQSWCLHYEPQDYFRFTKYGIKYLLEKNGLVVVSMVRIGGFFSLISQRFIDVVWTRLTGIFSLALPRIPRIRLTARCAERISSCICLPASLIFYFLAKFFDRLDSRDALGWAVLAKKI